MLLVVKAKLIPGAFINAVKEWGVSQSFEAEKMT